MKRQSLLSWSTFAALLAMGLAIACSDDAAEEQALDRDAAAAHAADTQIASGPTAPMADAGAPSIAAEAAVAAADGSANGDGGHSATSLDRDGGSGHDAGSPGPAVAGYLLVADLSEGSEAIYTYSLADLRQTGQLSDVRLAGHAGAIALRDGRVIAADDKHQRIVAIQLDAAGAPAIAAQVAADLGEGAVWGCGDAELRYLAVASGREGAAKQVANVVDLEDFSLHAVEVMMNVIDGEIEELHPAIAGEPLHLFLGVGAEIRAFPLADVLAGTASAPVASVAIHPGSHGPVVSHTAGLVYLATESGAGFDGVRVRAPFARAQLIPWDVDGRSTGRNGRPRLSWDGRYIYGAATQTLPSEPERWAERAVDLHVADLETATAHRWPLTTGIVPKFQLSRRYALFANVTANGDFAILVDVQPGSSAFQQVVARVELPRLRNGPVPGESSSGKEALGSAITPDGQLAFVSHGGEGAISVIDTATRAVIARIQTPSPLAGGGFLFAWQPGTTPVDTCMR